MYILNQINISFGEFVLSSARQEGDSESVAELMDRYQQLMERKQSFAPALSPYLRDTRTPKKSG